MTADKLEAYTVNGILDSFKNLQCFVVLVLIESPHQHADFKNFSDKNILPAKNSIQNFTWLKNWNNLKLIASLKEKKKKS